MQSDEQRDREVNQSSKVMHKRPHSPHLQAAAAAASDSPRPRSNLSNFSECQMDPETSILVSKVPEKSKRVTITTRSEYGPSTSYLNPVPAETEFRRTELIDSVKRLERQLDLKEENLKRLQRQLEHRDRSLKDKELVVRKLERDIERFESDQDSSSILLPPYDSYSAVKCRYSASGCPHRLPSMEYHEEKECRFRPTRCPSLTCPVRPPYARLMAHIREEHDGAGAKGRDRICRNDTDTLVSSYVNIDREPIFYKTTRMTWVANELVCDGRHFFLECMRNPPDWHLWVYLIGSEAEAEKYQTTIQLFREDEYGINSLSAQRSYTGQVISIHRSKEEIAEFSLGFQVNYKCFSYLL